MTDAEQPKRLGDGLEEHPLVAKLVPDATRPANAVTLAGFLGESPREVHLRLYLTLDLASYLEIAVEDVLHSEELPREHAPQGGSMLWVRRGAKLIETHVSSRETQAEFLSGALVGEFDTAEPTGVVGALTTAPCRISLAVCPSIRICPSERCPDPDDSRRCTGRCTARC